MLKRHMIVHSTVYLPFVVCQGFKWPLGFTVLFFVKCSVLWSTSNASKTLGGKTKRRLTSQRDVSGKSMGCSYCCHHICRKKGFKDLSQCRTRSAVDLWHGFWAKLLVHKQLWRMLINGNRWENGHSDLWKAPLLESGGRSCSLSSSDAFTKALPQHKRSAALSPQSLNNSSGSDVFWTSLGFCLWSVVTRGLDIFKTLLAIGMCTRKRMC